MKIHLDNVNLQSNTGPNSFAQRITKFFLSNGHEVTLDGTNADISLVFIEPSGQKLSKKIVQRLDGIWFKPEDFHTKNTNIRLLYSHADAVIWQSEFDKQMTLHHWNDPKSGVVIKNGIEVRKKTVQNQSLLQLQLKHEKLFVCSANWHPQKRLNENIKLFKHLKDILYPTAALIILGNNAAADMVVPKDVYYPGSLTHDQCLEIFAACDWMLHLAWLDHCPNTVVEALSQDLPVICTSAGGTQELINGFGVILKEEEYNYRLANYDIPPKLDFSSITSLPSKNTLIRNYDVSIENCGLKYLKLFSDMLL